MENRRLDEILDLFVPAFVMWTRTYVLKMQASKQFSKFNVDNSTILSKSHDLKPIQTNVGGESFLTTTEYTSITSLPRCIFATTNAMQ